MSSEKINLGKRGEETAVDFLKQNGYRVLKRNFKINLGEIDIVAREGNTVCFIEVKTRTSEILGHPFEAISRVKQQKLSRVGLAYLKKNGLMDAPARFDIVSVLTSERGSENVEILKDAFPLSHPYAY